MTCDAEKSEGFVTVQIAQRGNAYLEIARTLAQRLLP